MKNLETTETTANETTTKPKRQRKPKATKAPTATATKAQTIVFSAALFEAPQNSVKLSEVNFKRSEPTTAKADRDFNPAIRAKLVKSILADLRQGFIRSDYDIARVLAGDLSGVFLSKTGNLVRITSYPGKVVVRVVNPFSSRPNALLRAVLAAIGANSKHMTVGDIANRIGAKSADVYKAIRANSGLFVQYGKLIGLTPEAPKRFASLRDEVVPALETLS